MKPTAKEMEVFQAAVKAWGVDAQVCMLIEEMAELTKACLKLKRHDYRWALPGGGYDATWLNLAEEVADVELMLEQIKYMFEISRTPERKAEKLGKLKGMLPTP